MTTNEATIILDSSDKWEDWELKFKAQVVSYNLVNQIFDDEAFLDKPTKPVRPTYRTVAATRAQSTASSDTEAGTAAVNAHNAELKDNYRFDYHEYQEDMKAYNREIDSIRGLRAWLEKTVSSAYYKTSCSPTSTVRDWYNNLKNAIGQTDYQNHEHLRKRYRDAIKPLSKMPKDPEAWITNWEQIITEGKEKKLAFATECSDWYSNFMNAVKLVLPNWVGIFDETQVEKVEAGTLTSQELAKGFRRAVKRFPTGTARVAKGSFGLSFVGQAAEEDTPDSSESKENEKGGKNKGKKDSKRRKHTDTDAATACRGCGLMGHYHLHCFYLLPQKAPKGFKPREELKKAAEQALKEDTSLAEEIKRLRVSMDKDKDKERDKGKDKGKKKVMFATTSEEEDED
jgi:hypothetical protein